MLCAQCAYYGGNGRSPFLLFRNEKKTDINLDTLLLHKMFWFLQEEETDKGDHC